MLLQGVKFHVAVQTGGSRAFLIVHTLFPGTVYRGGMELGIPAKIMFGRLFKKVELKHNNGNAPEKTPYSGITASLPCVGWNKVRIFINIT
ncbi:MAG: hypothetical protein JW863_00755 [Chitinispirillaceae bacterium]|nr:hypothetical protein [Chitinispirillaceae bacterium]